MLKYFALFVSTCLFHSLVYAQVLSSEQFIDNMVTRHNFNRANLIKLLAKAKVRPSILKAIARPGEAKPWYQYRPLFVNEKRIRQGVQFWKAHAKTLERAQATYGVPAEIIIAIIGVETLYGQEMGNFRVIDALTTLSFHYPPRADFFRDELENFFLLCREEQLNPLNPKGSYAGAMGIGQFMPSSFRQYAVDFDRDGQRNIWSSVQDAVGSVANYLSAYGWEAGQPVIKATQVQPEAVSKLLALEFKPYPFEELEQQGLLFHGEKPKNNKGMLVDLETEQGTAFWIGFQNFYVITRYNRSKRYAMAVYQLAQEIARNYVKTI